MTYRGIYSVKQIQNVIEEETDRYLEAIGDGAADNFDIEEATGGLIDHLRFTSALHGGEIICEEHYVNSWESNYSVFLKDGDNDHEFEAKWNMLTICDRARALIEDVQQRFDDKHNFNGYNEPQAWYELPSGRAVEIVHQEDGLSPEDQYFSITLYRAEDERNEEIPTLTCWKVKSTPDTLNAWELEETIRTVLERDVRLDEKANAVKDILAAVKKQLIAGDNISEFGNPQAVVDLPNGRSIRVVHEETDLPRDKQFFLVQLCRAKNEKVAEGVLSQYESNATSNKRDVSQLYRYVAMIIDDNAEKPLETEKTAKKAHEDFSR